MLFNENLKSERLDLGPKRLDLRPKRLDLRPKRLDLRPERLDLRPERLEKLQRGGTYVMSDGRNGSPLCPTGHRPFGAAAQKASKTLVSAFFDS